LMSEEGAGPSWRAEPREPVRYTSPRPESTRRDRARESARPEARSVSPRRGVQAAQGRAGTSGTQRPATEIVLEPEHLASLTLEQRADLRVWHGRVNLRDRIKAMRGYVVLTAGAMVAAVGATVASEGPAVVSLIVPIYMAVKTWRRGKSLREAGLKLRRVLLMPRAKWVIPGPPPAPRERQLEKLASREVLDGPYGPAVRRAVEEREGILDIFVKLSKADRALLPDLVPTVNGLVERVAHLAQSIHRLDESIDLRLIDELDARIAEAQSDSESVDDERRLALLRRQRDTMQELVQRRAALARQLDNAGLALGNLRLDLIKLRSSGLQSALSDVSTATQEARALSREIGAALEAAAEVKSL
jgi:hypothetical protein